MHPVIEIVNMGPKKKKLHSEKNLNLKRSLNAPGRPTLKRNCTCVALARSIWNAHYVAYASYFAYSLFHSMMDKPQSPSSISIIKLKWKSDENDTKFMGITRH